VTIKAPLNPNQPAIYQWPGAILFSPTTGLLTEGCCFFHAGSAKTIILDHVHRLHQKICSGQSSLYNSNIIVLLTCCGDVVHAFLGSMLAAAPVCHRVGQNTVGEVFDSSFPILQFFWHTSYTTTTTTVLCPFFQDHPGEPEPEENFWTLWCKGRLTDVDTPTIWQGVTPSRLSSKHCPPPPPPMFFLQARCLSFRPTNSVEALKACTPATVVRK